MVKVTPVDQDAAINLDELHIIQVWNIDRVAAAFAHHRQYGYDQGYYDGCTRSVMQSEDCPKCDKFGEDCGEHSPSWEELAAYWKAEAERLRAALDALGFEIRKKNDG